MKRLTKRVLIFFIIIGLVFSGFIYIRKRVKPYITELTWIRGKELGSDAIGEAIVTVFGNEKLTYSDIALINYSPDGSVVSVGTDTAKLNYIRGVMSESLSDNLRKLSGSATVEVPLGSLLSVFLAGRGVRLKLHLDSINTTDVDFSSEFVSAGINQTLHRIKMKVTVEFTVLVASFKVKTVSTANFAVCETVIVGKVPEVYFGKEEEGEKSEPL